jgi:hypothetical protein
LVPERNICVYRKTPAYFAAWLFKTTIDLMGQKIGYFSIEQ